MALPPLRVLLVEDDPDAADLVGRLLTRDLDPRTVIEVEASLADAVGALLDHRRSFDVVVLDLGLPETSPQDPLHALRAVVATPSAPPVVVVTAHDEELGEEALGIGAQDYVVKGGLAGRRVLARAVSYAVQRHERTSELEQQRGRLLLVNSRLQQFASSLAHDLKGPVASASLALATARSAAARDRHDLQEEMLARAERILASSTEQVDRLLDEVLEVGANRRVEVDVAGLVDEVVHGLAARDRLHLELDLREPLTAQPGQVRQVLQNLVENALAHNPDRDVRVRVRTYRAEPFLCLCVEDDGVGIPVEERQRLLLRGAKREGSAGRGVGLATVALVAQAAEATLLVDASPDLGGARVQVAYTLQGQQVLSTARDVT